MDELESIHLPPGMTPLEVDAEALVARYVVIAVFGAWIWDGLLNIPDDVKMFRQYKIRLPDVVYILSRVSMLGFLSGTASMVFQPKDCSSAIKPVIWFSLLAIPPNAYLFVLRIQAVFYDSRIVKTFFIVMWLCSLAGSLLQPFCITFANIPLFRVCAATTTHTYCILGPIIVMTHDLLVLLSISTKLLLVSLIGTRTGRLQSFFSGSGLPRVSKLLMRTGQQYYLVTAVVNVAMVFIMISPSFSPIYHAIIFVPNIAISNIAACRVYRRVKLGMINDGSVGFYSETLGHHPESTLRFCTISGGNLSITNRHSTNRLQA
ncbi:hypothetical protein NLI96_g5397 [Meripilus lineatus]|uniref:Uncharacterized protein n=1 Tax=Meripilus lineatus TaxID=2056292 RepID=A0AAD5YGZ2_9APHY|nr:hypothetical protein NLI96_g5397 [Physisporinus lineatus]